MTNRSDLPSIAGCLFGVALAWTLGVAGAVADDCPRIARVDVQDRHGRPLRGGTAFTLDGERFVTSAHVVENASRVRLTTPDGDRIRVAAVGRLQDGIDLAVLQRRAWRGDGATLTLAPVASADAVRVLAHAPQYGFVEIAGRVLETDVPTPLGPAIELSQALLPGMSGAPVVDDACRVVAVANHGIESGRLRRAFALRPPVSASVSKLDAETGTQVADTSVQAQIANLEH